MTENVDSNTGVVVVRGRDISMRTEEEENKIAWIPVFVEFQLIKKRNGIVVVKDKKCSQEITAGLETV